MFLSDDVLNAIISCGEKDDKINKHIFNGLTQIQMGLSFCKQTLAKEIYDASLSDIIIDTSDLRQQLDTIKGEIQLIADKIQLFESHTVQTDAINQDNAIDKDEIISSFTEKITLRITTKTKNCPECHTQGEFPLTEKILTYKINQRTDGIIDKDSTIIYKCHNCNNLFIHRNNYHDIIRKYNVNKTNINFLFSYCRPSRIMFFDFLVVSGIEYCRTNNHKIVDIKAQINVLNKLGEIKSVDVVASYCTNCDKFAILKEDYNKIDGIILCRIIDESKKSNAISNFSDIQPETETLFHQYGYNVNCNDNLSIEQRHIILEQLIVNKETTKAETCSYLDALIKRGSQITNWDNAVERWKEDRTFVENIEIKSAGKYPVNRFIVK